MAHLGIARYDMYRVMLFVKWVETAFTVWYLVFRLFDMWGARIRTIICSRCGFTGWVCRGQITPINMIWCGIIWYGIVSYRIIPCHIMSYRIISYINSYHIVSYHTVWYRYHIILRCQRCKKMRTWRMHSILFFLRSFFAIYFFILFYFYFVAFFYSTFLF